MERDSDQILTPSDRVPAGRLARAYAWALTALRWIVVPAWIVAAVAATHYLPTLNQAQGNARSAQPSYLRRQSEAMANAKGIALAA